MPYISADLRPEFQPEIDSLTSKFLSLDSNSGNINYVFSKILKNLLEANMSYTEANKLIGCVECIKLELYRKLIANYEDSKEILNGPI